MPTPLFSTYRQGENRVTSSLLAVFERLGIDLVARLLGSALEQPELQLVRYRTLPTGDAQGVPDAEMKASFRFLFEVKTARNALHRDQLERHLENLDTTMSSHAHQLLVVLTPDAGPPPLVGALDDQRAVWTSFEALSQAVGDLLRDVDEPASEQQRFLLRELLALFALDRLLPGDDVAVVAARVAYDEWQKFGAYVCQPTKTFRDAGHFGFYRAKQVEREFPRVLAHEREVLFDEDTAEWWERSGEPHGAGMARVIREMLAAGLRTEGTTYGVVLLQHADDPELSKRDASLTHNHPGAWTQGQRYAGLDRLLTAGSTADLTRT